MVYPIHKKTLALGLHPPGFGGLLHTLGDIQIHVRRYINVATNSHLQMY